MIEGTGRFRLARMAYTVLIHLLIPAALLHFLWRSRREPAYRRHLGERLGFGPAPDSCPDLWVHAASLGEMRVAGILLRALAANRPAPRVLLTSVTPAGRAEAERIRAGGFPVDIRYLPLDSPWALRPFLRRWQPKALILVETELWPNLLWEAHTTGLPTVLVNARLGPRLRATYRRFRALYAPLLARLERVAAQSPDDARHLQELGAQRVEVTGNLKFDLPTPPPPALTRNRFSGDHLWIAGSTHPGEERILLEVHRRLRAVSHGMHIQLLIAPRHPARAREIVALAAEAGFTAILRSDLPASGTTADVVVLDTLGELGALYSLADAAFVGGSLVDHGGQNPLEPIAAGCPVVIGPDSRNFADMVGQLRAVGAILQVANPDTLLEALERLLGDSGTGRVMVARARETMRQNGGATARTLRLLDPLLPPAGH